MSIRQISKFAIPAMLLGLILTNVSISRSITQLKYENEIIAETPDNSVTTGFVEPLTSVEEFELDALKADLFAAQQNSRALERAISEASLRANPDYERLKSMAWGDLAARKQEWETQIADSTELIVTGRSSREGFAGERAEIRWSFILDNLDTAPAVKDLLLQSLRYTATEWQQTAERLRAGEISRDEFNEIVAGLSIDSLWGQHLSEREMLQYEQLNALQETQAQRADALRRISFYTSGFINDQSKELLVEGVVAMEQSQESHVGLSNDGRYERQHADLNELENWLTDRVAASELPAVQVFLDAQRLALDRNYFNSK